MHAQEEGAGVVASAQIAVLDDISRAPGEALNVLLRLLNERKYHERPIPLWSAVATGNPTSAEFYNEPLDPATLDRFVRDLNVHHGVPVEATEMLQRMRSGALMNGAGGTRGGRAHQLMAGAGPHGARAGAGGARVWGGGAGDQVRGRSMRPAVLRDTGMHGWTSGPQDGLTAARSKLLCGGGWGMASAPRTR